MSVVLTALMAVAPDVAAAEVNTATVYVTVASRRTTVMVTSDAAQALAALGPQKGPTLAAITSFIPVLSASLRAVTPAIERVPAMLWDAVTGEAVGAAVVAGVGFDGFDTPGHVIAVAVAGAFWVAVRCVSITACSRE